MPQPKVTLTKSHSGTVYAGKELVLTVDISFNDFKRVDVNISISIKWEKNSGTKYIQLVNDTRTTVSAVSSSEGRFKATLTYSPVAISDSGRHWIVVSIQPSDRSIHIKTFLPTAKNVVLIVNGD